MDCHHGTKGSEVTSIPPETQTLATDVQTQRQTLGILLDQWGWKAQGMPRVPTRTGIHKASIKLHIKKHRGFTSLEQGMLSVHCCCSKTRRGPGGCIGL